MSVKEIPTFKGDMMDDEKFKECVEEVHRWFKKASQSEQEEFKSMDKEGLIRYHHSLGRSIRNKFNLWEFSWIPHIVDECDTSPDHPDAISMRIIEAVWDKVKES